MNSTKRAQNERKFQAWEDLPEGGRRYSYEVPGRNGWHARYVKVVDANEQTLQFYQEVFDPKGNLVERHRKFPVDTGHQKLGDAN